MCLNKDCPLNSSIACILIFREDNEKRTFNKTKRVREERERERIIR